jgi:hypothetical protein
VTGREWFKAKPKHVHSEEIRKLVTKYIQKSAITLRKTILTTVPLFCQNLQKKLPVVVLFTLQLLILSVN